MSIVKRHRTGGQALVEFALAVIPFLILLMGVIDLGRGIYTMNGTSEAARDITRATIVHLTGLGGQLGLSDQTTDVIEKQRDLVPGLTIDPTTDIACVDAYDVVQNDKVSGNDVDCNLGVDFIRVRVTAPFSPITPLVSAFGTHTFESTSRMQIP
jgi:Flp pilus assembly protein TadG